MAVGMESVDSWWSQTDGASCGGLCKWRKEARVTLSLSDSILSAFGKHRGFHKESDVSGLNQQVHEGDIPGRLSRWMGVHIELSASSSHSFS